MIDAIESTRERRTFGGIGRWVLVVVAVLIADAAQASENEVKSDRSYANLEAPEHDYWNRPLRDPFTLMKGDLESGKVTFDHSSEKAYLVSLLKVLGIPASSQMLVFSTTSLQLRFISPRNPRAVYFNEDVYVGFIPGGRLEIVSIDPEVGGIYYIFDIPRDQGPPVVERSNRCMNCHANEDTHEVPGVVVRSVVPGPTGGTLNSFRRGLTGHAIPFEDRFGGWHVTGVHGIKQHWGNQTGRLSGGKMTTSPLIPGERFDFARYPVATSDILPHLLLEHQAGFANRFIEASYKTRTYLREDGGMLSREHAEELNAMARELTRYLLFADEVALPGGGIEGDEAFVADFLASRKAASDGPSLKDLDLRTRLFKYRCSYMIYSAAFRGLPDEMKRRVYRGLQTVLGPKSPPEFSYLALSEKQVIRKILKETLTDLPEGW